MHTQNTCVLGRQRYFAQNSKTFQADGKAEEKNVVKLEESRGAGEPGTAGKETGRGCGRGQSGRNKCPSPEVYLLSELQRSLRSCKSSSFC